jgi:hypothetical protein
MTDVLEKYYKGNNFWEVSPEYRILEVFEDFYKLDKSHNKDLSSNVMWAIAFCLIKRSPMYNLPNKWELAAGDIIKDKKFNWDRHDRIIQMFKQVHLSQAERSLIAWEELMAKRDKYLKAQEYYFDKYFTNEAGDNVKSRTGQFITLKGTADQLDRAFAVTPKMYSEFDKIKKTISEDEIKRGKANKPISLSESGEI